MAIQLRDPEVFQILLEDPRINPALDDNLLLRYAQEHKTIEFVKPLLQDPRVFLYAIRHPNLRTAPFVQKVLEYLEHPIIEDILEYFTNPRSLQFLTLKKILQTILA